MISNEKAAAAGLRPDEGLTVFIVDDDPEVRRSISVLVRSVGLEARMFGSARDFLDAFDPNVAGCLVLDMRMPGMTGLQLQQALNERNIRIPIVFITAHGEIPTATSAMRAGAIDFIPKPFSPQLLLERIQEAIAIDRERRSAQQLQQEIAARIATLTDREREVMEHLATGKPTKTIASLLGISSKTVDNHRAKVLEKLQVENATQLAHLLSAH